MEAATQKIIVNEVTVAFNGFVAVEGVDLRVARHELVSIVGTSGGGKTTLLRAMGGLVPLKSGNVLLDGQPIVKPTPLVAMIFQHFGLFPWKTVRANIAYGLSVQRRRDDEGIVDQLLEVMNLRDSADKYPWQLSGGMQQRVGIARALALRPDVLLMDEPLSALDALTRETLQTELLRLWESQSEMTAVLVTHDIDEAILLSDRIMILRGRPGTIDMQVKVPIERPRDAQELRFHPEYPKLRRRIWNALHEDQQSLGQQKVDQ